MFLTACRRPRLLIGLTLIASLLMTGVAQAQQQASVRLSPPVLDDFPEVSFLLSVSGGDGHPVGNLDASDLQVIEDGESRPVERLDEIEVGTQQLFVINTNEGLGIRDSRGRTRFHFARLALLDWWSGSESAAFGTDDLTLVVGDSPLIERSHSAATLAAALDGYDPEFTSAQSSLSLLLDSLRYLDTTAARGTRPSFVMYVTSLPRDSEQLALTNLIDRARQIGATVFPVLIDVEGAIDSPEAAPLHRIAEATGGEVYALDPTDPRLSELATRLAAQRLQYRVAYRSAVDTSGTHELQVRVESGAVSAEAEPRTFEVQVRPPEVTFVQPPHSLTRQSDDPAIGVERLPPTEEGVNILITFPDGNPRQLVSSRLFADGEVVAERTSAPFDAFVWDLTSLHESQTTQLQAVVTDSLGLQGETGVHAVQVSVVPAPGGLAALRPALGSLLLVIGVLVAGVLGALALLTFSRREEQAEPSSSAQAPRAPQRAQIQPEPDASAAEALLIPIGDSGQDGQPIPLVGADITLGRDAALAAHPFTEPSVSSLHARVIRQAGGDYVIRDQGSVAGTWVNYEEVPEEGQRLVHGDVVHLGRVELRFRLPHPPEGATVRIVPAGGEGSGDSERDQR